MGRVNSRCSVSIRVKGRCRVWVGVGIELEVRIHVGVGVGLGVVWGRCRVRGMCRVMCRSILQVEVS